MNRNLYQNGNVLFVVLAGIALFAALTVAVNRSNNTDGGAVMGQAEAKLHAATIIDFGNAVEQAVSRLTSIGGCDITEVSFEKSPFDGSDTDYVNPNSPSDNSCHVFNPSGGQVEMIEFDDKWKDTEFSTATAYGDWFFSIMCFGEGAPSCNSTDETVRRGSLLIYAPIIKVEICQEINTRLIGTSEVFLDDNALFRDDEQYVGDFTLDVPHVNMVSPNEHLNTVLSMCVQSSTAPAPNSYNYYNTLFLREDTF